MRRGKGERACTVTRLGILWSLEFVYLCLLPPPSHSSGLLPFLLFTSLPLPPFPLSIPCSPSSSHYLPSPPTISSLLLLSYVLLYILSSLYLLFPSSLVPHSLPSLPRSALARTRYLANYLTTSSRNPSLYAVDNDVNCVNFSQEIG